MATKKKIVSANTNITALKNVSTTLATVLKTNSYPDAVFVRLEKIVADLNKLADRTSTVELRQSKKAERTAASNTKKAERKARLEERIKKMQEQLGKIAG